MKIEYTTKQNPLKALKKGKRYKKNESPLSRDVVDKLARQRYLTSQVAMIGGISVPMYSLSYRGDIFQAKPFLKEWQFNDQDVMRELDGVEATALLYGQTNK